MELFENKVMPPGEKIKTIRTMFDLKQKDIAGDAISRSLISYIENGKTALIEETAKIIADNINCIAKNKKIDILITPEMLLEGESIQANRILQDIYCSLKDKLNSIDNKFLKSQQFRLININDFDVDLRLKSKTYMLLGDGYFNIRDISNSYSYYFKALEYSIKADSGEDMVNSLLNLAKCSLENQSYKEALTLNKHAYIIMQKNGIEEEAYVKRIYFNNALIYKKVGLYDKCLEALDKLELKDYNFTIHQLLDTLQLKANCYLNLNLHNLAKIAHEMTLDIAKDHNLYEYQAMTLMNIANILHKDGQTEKGIQLALEALEIRNKYGSYKTLSCLLFLGNAYWRTNSIEKSLQYLADAKDIITHNSIDELLPVYELMMKVYIRSKNAKALKELVKEVLKLPVEEKNIDSKLVRIKDILVEIAEFFIDVESQYSKQLIRTSLDLNKKLREV